MHRNKVLELLKNYNPTVSEEIIAKEKMIYFIQTEKDCFERSLEKGHMTASCWLLNFDGSKALLMHHAKLNCWVQPGGHADGNPDLLEVAQKEAIEESGMSVIEPLSSEIFDLDIHLIPENSGQKAHYHYDIRFLLQAKKNENVQKNHESKALLWIDKNQSSLPTHEPSILRMFMKWNQYKRVFNI